MPSELKYYLNHWGFYLTDDQFHILFHKLDFDKDGKISYEDFQNSVGNEITPTEFLYFRQDLRQQKPIRCLYKNCWETTIGIGSYCALHTRIIYNNAFEWMTSLPEKLKDKWISFCAKVKQNFNSSEDQEISLDVFQQICEEFNIKVNDHDKELFYEAFPGKYDGNIKSIDMSHLIEILPASEINIIYNKVDLSDDDEEMGDFSGYTGIVKRGLKTSEILTYEKLIDVFANENKLPFIMRSIKDIDQDNNGYVTTTEFEDILKLHYPELNEKNLKKLFKPFASIQNRILIDYKKFRKDLIKKIKNKLENKEANATAQEKEDNVFDANYQSAKQLKTKLNSLTVGNILKLENETPRTVRKTEEDDVMSHVTISKASFHQKSVHTAVKSSRKQASEIKFKPLSPKNLFREKLINEPIKETEEEEHYPITQIRTRVFSNKNLQRITNPLINNQSRLDTISKHNKMTLLFSPHRTKTPLNVGNKNLMRSQGTIKLLNQYNNNQFKIRNQNSNQFNTELEITKKKLIEKVVENAKFEGLITKLDQCTSMDNEDAVKTLPAMLYNSKTLGKNKNGDLNKEKPDSKVISRLNFLNDFKSEQLKCRLLYEWKNIFRILALADINQTGLVNRDQFIKAINKCKVFLSREDINKIYQNYNAKQADASQNVENKDKINYFKLTEDIGASENSMRLIQQSRKYLNQFKQLRSSSEVSFNYKKSTKIEE